MRGRGGYMQKNASGGGGKFSSHRQIGMFIRQRREELGINQSTLCQGICSISSLSKIENGMQEPRGKTLALLLNRLGFPAGLINMILVEADVEAAIAVYNAEYLFSIEKYAEACEIADSLSSEYENLTKPRQQFLDLMSIVAMQQEGYISHIMALTSLEKLLRDSCPSYQRDELPDVLSFEEVCILIRIAHQLERIGLVEEAVAILKHLRGIHESVADKNCGTPRLGTMVLARLSKYLGILKRFDECIEICELGIKSQNQDLTGRYLAEFILNQILALAGRDSPGDLEKAKESAWCLLHLCRTIGGMEDKLDWALRFMQERLDVKQQELIDFIEQ